MTDARTEAWLDQEDARTAQIIREHGVFIQYVGGSCPCDACGTSDGGLAFAYSVGFFGLHHPEVLLFSVDPGTATGVINALFARVRAGDNLVAGQPVSFPEWPHQLMPEVVPNPGEIAFAANRFYGRPDAGSVPVLQLTYDDAKGRFPWDQGCTLPPLAQPRPGDFRA